jgi:V8-like Glu-specific endopeptidase
LADAARLAVQAEIPMSDEAYAALKQEVRALISEGDLPLATDRLKTASHAVSPRLYDDVLLIEAKLNRLLRDSRRGTISRDSFDAGLSQIAQSLLSVADSVPALAQQPPAASGKVADKQTAEEILSSVGPAHESILGINNLKQISWIRFGVAVSACIGRIITPNGMGTGFLVGRKLVMTNHHVVPDADVARRSFVEMNYEQDVSGGFLPSVRYALDSSRFMTTGPFLDCTIVGVAENPGKPAIDSWGKATLNPNADPVPTEHVIVIQHPNGGYKQIVLTANYVVAANGHTLLYTTDTMPGSSGSPVFNDSWHVIAIHHAGGQLHVDEKGAKRYVNKGILMSAIRSAINSGWPQ